jgi:hypothetical protein
MSSLSEDRAKATAYADEMYKLAGIAGHSILAAGAGIGGHVLYKKHKGKKR